MSSIFANASFGSSAQPQQQNNGGLFGSTTQNQPQQQQGGGLFGSLTQPPQQQGGGLFGSLGAQNQAQPVSQPASNSVTAASTHTLNKLNPFGSVNPNIGAGVSLANQNNSSFFGSLAKPEDSQQPTQQQQQQQIGSIIGPQSRIWTEQDVSQRQKSVTEQIELVFTKWHPEAPNSVFQTYLYSQVDPREAPFYRAGPGEDEDKYEEALQKKPSVGAVPVIVKGFHQLGLKIVQQGQYLQLLHGRLHEINAGLMTLLQEHDLKIAVRATECRRRHLRLSQKCLALATKTQVLRNRGYAMDGAEEQLRQKLIALERNVFAPELNGRGEEIWARMVMVRQRGRQLQFEFEKAGKSMKDNKPQPIDEETMKRAKKIMEDYDSQLSHLAKELEQIKTDYTEWEQSKGATANSFGGAGR